MLTRLAALLLAATPAAAWEFAPHPICTLTSTDGPTAVTVTYDPAIREYAIHLTLPRGTWPDAPVFALRFDGPSGLRIATDRHRLAGDGTTLSVTDRGFGNVLDGLEFNHTATALIGDMAIAIPLDGAAGPVEAFRACPAAPVS